MIELRKYQIAALDALRASIRAGHRAPILCAPTASGKTVVFCEIIRLAAQKQSRSLVLCHRKELIEQCSAKLRDIGLPHGIIKAGYPADRRHQVQIGSVQSVANRLHRYGGFDIVIADEAHLSIAPTWHKVIAAVRPKCLIGATATPARLDGKGLAALFDDIIIATTTAELIELGFACQFRYFAPSSPDLSEVHIVAGEYQRDELADVMDKPTITGCAISCYSERCPGVPALAFCVGIQHAENTAEQFRAAGFRALAVSGKSPPDMRACALRDLAAGRLDVLTNAQLFIEGLDVPNIGAIFTLAPTRSLTRFLQRIGRGMRVHPGKSELLIFDHGDDWSRHGLPDEPREWSLNGRRKRSGGERAAPCKLCPQCFRTVASAVAMCPQCGCTFKVKPREIRRRDGELVEIGAATIRKRRSPKQAEQQAARTYDDLVRLGRSRGYRSPERWAAHIAAARRVKSEVGSHSSRGRLNRR